MTVAIDFSTHRARLLKAGPGGLGPSLDNPHAGRPAPSMEERPGFSSAAAFRFDGFCLLPKQRLLLEADLPVPLGSRALDILIALTERHGELVTRRELMSRVWPGIAVVDANLSVQMVKLRRALHDGQRGKRYLVTTPGQGYRFVAPISIVEEPPSGHALLPPMEDVELRAMLLRLIGSADEVSKLASKLLQASDASQTNQLSYADEGRMHALSGGVPAQLLISSTGDARIFEQDV